jgi:hypothetical protein
MFIIIKNLKIEMNFMNEKLQAPNMRVFLLITFTRALSAREKIVIVKW